MLSVKDSLGLIAKETIKFTILFSGQAVVRRLLYQTMTTCGSLDGNPT